MGDVASMLDLDAMKKFVKEYLTCNEPAAQTGYNAWRKNGAARWAHTLRVLVMAQEIARAENADFDLVTVATIFHDVAKLNSEQDVHAIRGAEIARDYLTRAGLAGDWVERVCEVIVHHPAMHVVPVDQMTPEIDVLRDADLLDETGAMGILWTAMNAGLLESTSYANTRERIVKHDLTGIRRVIELMLTRTGRAMAQARLAVVEVFIAELDVEMRDTL